MTKLKEVTSGCVAAIYYTLRDADGQLLDTNRKGGKPLVFLQGVGQVVAGLDKGIVGRKRDEFFELEVAPEDAYGAHNPEATSKVPRSMFPADAAIEPGLRFTARDEQGRSVPGLIVSIEGDQVTVDHNHPLAGKTLHFEITVAGIREATSDEQQHGHAHGPGGHEH